MEPQIVLKIDNNHTLKASNFKIFLGACPQTPLGACDYRTSVLMSTPNNFYPHTPMLCMCTWNALWPDSYAPKVFQQVSWSHSSFLQLWLLPSRTLLWVPPPRSPCFLRAELSSLKWGWLYLQCNTGFIVFLHLWELGNWNSHIVCGRFVICVLF